MKNFRVLLLEGLLLSASAGLAVQSSLDLRATIDHTQIDLRRAQDFERQHSKEIKRYERATSTKANSTPRSTI
jgi:hypothetical protein